MLYRLTITDPYDDETTETLLDAVGPRSGAMPDRWTVAAILDHAREIAWGWRPEADAYAVEIAALWPAKLDRHTKQTEHAHAAALGEWHVHGPRVHAAILAELAPTP